MKLCRLNRPLGAALISAGLLGAWTLTAADPTPAAGAAGDRAARAGRGGILDDQQRRVLREALQRDRAKLQTLEQQIEAAQRALMEAVLAEQFDEASVQAKAEALTKLQAQMMVLRGKALNSVAPTLTPEQRQQLLASRFGATLLGGGLGPMDAGGGPAAGFGGGRGGQGFAPGAGRGGGLGGQGGRGQGQGRGGR